MVELGGADVVLSDGAEELLDIVELEGGADDEDGGALDDPPLHLSTELS